ncbi:E3 ubiquitin-protein ligase TRIM33-like [Apostichopus japonicus]|uniref:E3 ubiquitin-protein ligase TRIM33-like n=1 Tax=Stichopus japonicus TaxID=307972 RepID=UPI003AB6A434
MASSTALTDLAENFFLCSVCLDQYKEPKQLPCLHRYCRNCLKTVIQASSGGKLKCPLCKQEYVIPENGVDDFKTDFHMNSMLEFIQLQKSFENKDIKKCVSCFKNTKVSAYCFKCRDYLCGQCCKVHVISKMFTDHKTRILRLDNMEAKNMTLDKLTSLTEDPRCHIHDKKEAQLCCSSCENVPVCIACTYNKHKGHDLHDVTEIAERERKLLKQEFAKPTKYKNQLYGLQTKIQTTAEKLNENAVKKTEGLTNQHKQQTQEIADQLAEYTKERKRGLEDIECRRRVNDGQITLNLEEELRQVREEYDEISKTANQKYDKESEDFINKCDITEGPLLRKLGSLKANFQNLTTANELRVYENKDVLKQITEYCEQVIKRYENLKAKTSCVLASKDDWTDVQCIPDIRAACEPMIKEMKKEFPVLESLSDFSVCDIQKVTAADIEQDSPSLISLCAFFLLTVFFFCLLSSFFFYLLFLFNVL